MLSDWQHCQINRLRCFQGEERSFRLYLFICLFIGDQLSPDCFWGVIVVLYYWGKLINLAEVALQFLAALGILQSKDGKEAVNVCLECWIMYNAMAQVLGKVRSSLSPSNSLIQIQLLVCVCHLVKRNQAQFNYPLSPWMYLQYPWARPLEGRRGCFRLSLCQSAFFGPVCLCSQLKTLMNNFYLLYHWIAFSLSIAILKQSKSKSQFRDISNHIYSDISQKES